LYGSIIIPEAVYKELTENGTALPGCKEVQTYHWIKWREAVDRHIVISLAFRLNEADAEAIALGIELNADWVLIDEHRSKTVLNKGIKRAGVLAILIAAKERGLIPLVKPVMDLLIAQTGFWVSSSLYSRILEEAGEMNL
ncbi:MAG: DUF3368 domain-containing protein, partial [Okeania sp. SIO2H7]|nr:DUF3368 domain-containing protein [Okeania sp. SIO2H7]